METVFSETEFNIMVEQLLDEKNVSFDMLCFIAEKTLRSSVERWCATDAALRGRRFEDDIMQEIQLRLIKTCKSLFLLRNGINGPVNDDPKGFKSWMFKVALNIKRDFANSVRKLNVNELDIEHGRDIYISPDYDKVSDMSEDEIKSLSKAFSVVVDSDANVYKILTWIAQCLFVTKLNITKIKSNELIVEKFEEKTLGEMYHMIIEENQDIPWLKLSEEQKDRMVSQLSKKNKDDKMFSEIKYKEFFMKKGGKATISDWVNRMNNLVKRVMDNGASYN